MENGEFIIRLRKLLQLQSELDTDPSTDRNYNVIKEDIEDFVKGENEVNENSGKILKELSLNTLKRIYNHKNLYPDYNVSNSSQDTKDTICMYLGFCVNQWEEFVEYWSTHSTDEYRTINRSESVIIKRDKDKIKNIINTVKVNATFKVYITGGQVLQLQKLSETGKYRLINYTKPIKLQRNDIIKVDNFFAHKPLIVSAIIRNGEYAGTYFGSQYHVISKLEKD